MKKLILNTFLSISAACCALDLPAAADAACPSSNAGAEMKGSADREIRVLLKIKPGHLSLGEPFQADVTVCAVPPQHLGRVSLNASMPEHRHGMNYQPTVASVEPGRYAVSGLLFHMPGLWRFEAVVFVNGEPLRFFHDVTVE